VSHAARLVLILTENETLVPPSDVRALVEFAVAAERAGFDGVMASEHVVLGTGSDAAGRPGNPREYALPGNQDPATPWPSSLLLLSGVAAVTARVRLVAGAVIPPLRHPLLLAKEIATLDRLSGGRLVVQPTVSWHRAEYAALGVPFERRGRLLDEHLGAWRAAWSSRPAAYEGEHYRFHDVWVVPSPTRPEGPPMWFGSDRLHAAVLRRLARYGSGFNPLGRVDAASVARVRATLAAAGRDPDELELVGGTRARFPDATGTADLAEALATIPEQARLGFGTFCIKPSQFLDDLDRIEPWCAEVVERVDRLVGVG
jgi:probable F420-dependent oxidoreductase